VPNYSYCCTNAACQHTFVLHLQDSNASQSIQFCPVCSSLAQRDSSDYATVRPIKERQFHDYPEEARTLQHFVEHHVHGPGCGCVLSHTHQSEPLKTEATLVPE
jgi:hypothetical protein